MPSEKNVVREGGMWPFKSRCQKANQENPDNLWKLKFHYRTDKEPVTCPYPE